MKTYKLWTKTGVQCDFSSANKSDFLEKLQTIQVFNQCFARLPCVAKDERRVALTYVPLQVVVALTCHPVQFTNTSYYIVIPLYIYLFYITIIIYSNYINQNKAKAKTQTSKKNLSLSLYQADNLESKHTKKGSKECYLLGQKTRGNCFWGNPLSQATK